MEHPHSIIGRGYANKELLDRFEGRLSDKYVPMLFFAPDSAMIQEHGILNCGLGIYTHENESVLRRTLADLACVSPDLADGVMASVGTDTLCWTTVEAFWEQLPHWDNRIELSDKTDAFGMPQVKLYWKKNEVDLRTIQVAARLLGEFLAKEDYGRLRLRSWVTGDEEIPTDRVGAGFHHMGGARMARTKDTGVVDRNCALFGQENMYVAGSSVYPSTGHANPVLTIVQLALRLAHHLSNRT